MQIAAIIIAELRFLVSRNTSRHEIIGRIVFFIIDFMSSNISLFLTMVTVI